MRDARVNWLPADRLVPMLVPVAPRVPEMCQRLVGAVCRGISGILVARLRFRQLLLKTRIGFSIRRLGPFSSRTAAAFLVNPPGHGA